MEPKRRILVVDDEPAMVGILRSALESKGYEVTEANDGEQALMQINQLLPELIISDVVMPKMDGYAFYKELKKNERTATIPVIIITVRGKMADSFSALGVDDFLTKPYYSQKVLDKVEALLAKPASRGTTTVVSEATINAALGTPGNSQPNWAMLGMGAFVLIAFIAISLIIYSLLSTPRQGNIKFKGAVQSDLLK